MVKKKPVKQLKIVAQKLELCKKCSSRVANFGLTKNKQYRVLCGACNA